MARPLTNAKSLFLATGVAVGWLAVVGQYCLIIANRVLSVLGTTIKFFSYFTILTNILVAVCLTSLLLIPQSRWGRYFSRAQVLTAIAVYITVVGLVYNVILRFLWKPQGWQRVVDELLHSVVPVLFVVFWLLFVPKRSLQWRDAFPWLLYPFVYLVYILLRGAWSGQYPYPFIDVNELGYPKVGQNGLALFAVFLVLSWVYVAIGKITSRVVR